MFSYMIKKSQGHNIQHKVYGQQYCNYFIWEQKVTRFIMVIIHNMCKCQIIMQYTCSQHDIVHQLYFNFKRSNLWNTPYQQNNMQKANDHFIGKQKAFDNIQQHIMTKKKSTQKTRNRITNKGHLPIPTNIIVPNGERLNAFSIR